MQVDNKLLDDLTRVASGAFGALAGVRGEVEAQLRHQFERILSRMDVVTRDEFEAVRAMAANARAGQEDLAERVANLEATVATLLAERELAHEHPPPRRPARSHAPSSKATPPATGPDTEPPAKGGT